MEKRAPLRQHYMEQDKLKLQSEQHSQTVAQLNALEKTLVSAFNHLVNYLDGKTTKTEVINQLQSISTPDVEKVVNKLSQVQNTILGNKVDLKPLIEAVNGVKAEVSSIPEVKFPDQKDEIKVSNLSEVKLDTTAIEKAIKDLKLDPKIDIEAPIINVKEPDLNPIKDLLLDVVKAINKIDIPEAPTTDLSKLEGESKEHTKQLKEANKHLKEIVDKPIGGGGGGGGNGTPYQTTEGKMSYVTLQDGAVPVTSALTTSRYDYSNSTLIYTGLAALGTSEASSVWTITKYDLTDTSNASGKVALNASWTGRAGATYV